MSGTVWKRPDGTWAYRVAVGRKADGAPNRRQRNGFSTKREAEAALLEFLGEAHKGTVVVDTKQTLGDYLEAWLRAVESSLRPATYDQYQNVLRCWVIPRIGFKRLAAIDAPTLQNLYTGLSQDGGRFGRGLSPSSVGSTHRILRRALDQAVEWGLLGKNPAAVRIHRPRLSGAPAAAWGLEEARIFLSANRNHRLFALFALMLSTGLRRGEVLGLRWRDVDLEGRRLTIVQARVAVAGGVQLSEPKTKAGVRIVELGASTVALLDKHRAAEGGRSEYVFTTPTGEPIHPQNLRRAVESACKRAGLPVLTPKGFRHTAATCALAAGVHPKKVQEMLGHSDIGITLGTYSHVVPGMHRDAADALDVALFPDEDEES